MASRCLLDGKHVQFHQRCVARYALETKDAASRAVPMTGMWMGTTSITGPTVVKRV